MSEVRVQRSFGSAAHSCCSTTTGSSDSAMPMRFATRSTWRSTGRPGTPSACPSTTFAVLRPTPGSSTSASMLAGTSPPCVATSACAMPMSAFDFARKKPVEWICGSSCLGRRFRERARVGVALEQRRRDQVDARVGGLRRQDRRDEQLERRPVVQLGVGVRVLRLEPIEDLARLARGLHVADSRLSSGSSSHATLRVERY